MSRESSTKKKRPTIKDMITRPFYHNPVISPDGKKVAFTRANLNLSSNGMDGKFFIYDTETKQTHYVFADGKDAIWLDNDSYAVNRHSPSGDSRWSDIYLVKNMMGEGVHILGHTSRIQFYAPFGGGFVFQTSKSLPKTRVGDYIHVENDMSQTSALYYVSPERAIQKEELQRQHFEEEQYEAPRTQFEITSVLDAKYHITSVVVSDVTNSIYVNCQKGTDLIFEQDTTTFKLTLDPDVILENAEETSMEESLDSVSLAELSLPKGFIVKAVSPNGEKLLVTGPVPGTLGQPRNDLWLISDDEACNPNNAGDSVEHLRLLTEKLDRQPSDIHWTQHGIIISHWQESVIVLTRLSEDGEFESYHLGDVSPNFNFSINDRGDIAFPGFSPTAMQEVYFASLKESVVTPERITHTTEEFAHLDLGTVESIRWTSKDGTEIEGLLRKPSDFDPTKKYPLVLYPHGGPRASSCLSLVPGVYAHPVNTLVGKGILVLEPNYRGGLGRGREFMDLNHNNLGVADLWDLESGIDHLIELGFVDETKIGSMGGSQGGYLSAYLGMHTDRCAAVASFAGVSSWYLYYIGSDSRHTVYMDGSPFDKESRENFRRSAPIAAIDRAKTPMLLHHGANDQRITVVSSQELHRALKDKGVHTELIVLPGKGHGFITPRENYALSLHQYRWFCHYLLGEKFELFKDDF